MRTWSQLPKEEHGTGPWLAQRWALPSGEKLVSASAAAAIYGQHPFISPEQLAAELLAPEPPQPKAQSDAMERGTRMEGFLMDWANDKMGRFFVTPDVLYVYCEGTARLIATLDGFDGTEILEIKTTTREWTGELPFYWYIQGVQQAVCANADVVNWAIFDRTQTLHLYKQTVTSDEKAEHIKAVGDWLESIDNGIPPMGVAWTKETVATRFPVVNREVVEIGPRAAELVTELNTVKTEQKLMEERRDRLEAELCDLLGDAGTGTVNGEVVVTWKNQSRRSLDQKALKEAHPDLVEQYTKESTFRVLRTKGNQ